MRHTVCIRNFDLPRFVFTIMNNIAIDEIRAISDDTIKVTILIWPQTFLCLFIVYYLNYQYKYYSSSK